jgi:hypothetical protein
VEILMGLIQDLSIQIFSCFQLIIQHNSKIDKGKQNGIN